MQTHALSTDQCIMKFSAFSSSLFSRMWSGRLSLELYDTSQEMEDIDIRTVLIQKGLAAAVASKDDSMDGLGQPAPTGDGDVCYVPG